MIDLIIIKLNDRVHDTENYGYSWWCSKTMAANQSWSMICHGSMVDSHGWTDGDIVREGLMDGMTNDDAENA